MRTSISNMVGVLPPHYFDVTVSTMGENLAQLMFSVIMTGAQTLAAPCCLSSVLLTGVQVALARSSSRS